MDPVGVGLIGIMVELLVIAIVLATITYSLQEIKRAIIRLKDKDVNKEKQLLDLLFIKTNRRYEMDSIMMTLVVIVLVAIYFALVDIANAIRKPNNGGDEKEQNNSSEWADNTVSYLK